MVTDVNSGLPWWMTGAQPQAGQPTPPGYGGGASWLNYLASMFSPVGGAEAGEIDPRAAAIAALRQGGSPQAGALAGGGPPVPAGSGAVGGPTGGTEGAPMGGGPARPATGMGLQPGALSPSSLAMWTNMPTPSGGGGAASVANAYPAPGAPGAANPLASSGAAVTGSPASANPSRFVQVDRPNADPLGRGAPQMSALNLAGLFGGWPPRQGNSGGNPANVPARNAQPVAALRGPMSKAPWGMGPFQRGSYGPRMPLTGQ